MDSFINLRRSAKCASLAGAALLFVGSVAYADDGFNHQVESPRPIHMGVSVSGIEFISYNGALYCYAGTAGALVEDAANPANQFILSNNHVLARENDAPIGEATIQPGLLDNNGDPGSCSDPNLDYTQWTVAQLSNFVPINFKVLPVGRPDNEVDAAIAAVIPGAVSGDILDIGLINPVTVPATIGMAVQKSGRTSGHTFGTVQAVDVSIAVQYTNGYGVFKNQIRVTGNGGPFITAGDSGSLMATVEDVGVNSHAVGLLFAGSDTDSFANPIDTVLSALGVNMAGCSADSACGSSGGGSGGGGGGKGGGGNGGGKKKGNLIPLGLEIASQVKANHEQELFRIPGVVGTGLSVDENGNPVIEVYVANRARRAVSSPIPVSLEGIPVRVIETGVIRAF